MDTDIQLLLIFIICIAYQLYKKYKKYKAKKLTKLYLDYFNIFKLDVLKSFNDYILTNKILVCKNEALVALTSKKYIHSDLKGAFLEIENQLLANFNYNMFLPNGNVFNNFYREINNVFNNNNEIHKLRYINSSIKHITIDIAIKYHHSSIINDHKKSIGAQFIALKTFENENNVERSYPKYDYKNFRQLLKKRKKNTNVPFEEFLENFT